MNKIESDLTGHECLIMCLIIRCRVWAANPEMVNEQITPDTSVGERRGLGPDALVAKGLKPSYVYTFIGVLSMHQV